MDFETFMPAVPLFDNARPYQQVPFQFCVYYLGSKGVRARVARVPGRGRL